VLLRGINVGSSRRVPMPALRQALADAGFDEVATYVQSGNIVLTSPLSAAKVTDKCARVIKEAFGLDLEVVVRSRDQLAKVVESNPIPDAAEDPKHYQVSFLAGGKPDAGALARAKELALDSEHLVVKGNELYAWHPAGIARSKLSAFIASQQFGATATARNWSTVTKLLEMASD
jgi:uncharacterized protein (DUF1697 family)